MNKRVITTGGVLHLEEKMRETADSIVTQEDGK